MACHDFSVPNIQNFLLPFRNYSTDTSVWDMLMPYIQCIKYSIFKICLGRTFNLLMKLHKQISDSLDSLCFKLHLSVGLQIIEIFFRAPVRLRWYPPPTPIIFILKSGNINDKCMYAFFIIFSMKRPGSEIAMHCGILLNKLYISILKLYIPILVIVHVFSTYVPRSSKVVQIIIVTVPVRLDDALGLE